MIAGVTKVYAGSDVVTKVYAGSDVVYSQGGGGDTTIELIIQSNAYVRAYIQAYPWLYQRIYEWPNLLFSLATDKPYMSTLENGGTGYFLLPIRTSVSNIDITLLYKAVSGKYARIYGSRTYNSPFKDDIWTLINENQEIINRLGTATGTLKRVATGSNYIMRLTKNWSSSSAGTVSATVDGTNYSGSGSGAGFTNASEPQPLFGMKSAGSIMVSDNTDNLYISRVIYADTYEYVPYGASLLDIRNNTVLSAVATGFTWHLFSTMLKTEISNPDISLLLS